jgi:hypothetical protein
VISCPDCNLKKHAKDPYEFANSIGRLLWYNIIIEFKTKV